MSLRGAAGFPACEPCCIVVGPGDETERCAPHQDLARETLPLGVGGEQLGGLPPLDRPSRQSGVELDQSEVADEPVVVPPEPLQRDHADRPRADTALRGEATEDRGGRVPAQALEVDGARKPDESRRAMLGQPDPPQLGRAEPRERIPRHDLLPHRPHHRALERARPLRLDQLSAHRPHDRVRDGRQAEGPVADERPGRRTDQRIACEALVEGAGVVVESEHEAGLVDAFLVWSRDDDEAVGALPRRGASAPDERCVPPSRSDHQPQPVRTAGGENGFDHRARIVRSPDTVCSARYRRAVRVVDAISLRSRRRKLELLLEELRPSAATTVLDVGVDEVSLGDEGGERGCSTHNFFEERYPWPDRVTALGLHDGARFRERYARIRYVQGDACALPFEDGAFDIVHSNAVIEHVGGRERQEAFVREAVRVGRRVFITTPNRWFPIEVHTRLPLVHWLPDRLAHRAYDLTGRGFAKENHLLGPGALRGLFPVPVRVVNLGMTLVAIT